MQRTITVYNSTTQTKTVFENVDITTLGEFKTLLREKNINYSDMDFQEGVSQTHLLNDSSILPSNIPYKGQLTNDLVIFMTLKNNKVKSGADFSSMDRRSLLAFIKERGFAPEINEEFGQNYTRISSASLASWLTAKMDGDAETLPQEVTKPAENPSSGIVNAFSALVFLLMDDGYISKEDAERLSEFLCGEKPEEKEVGYSLDEIARMQKQLSGKSYEDEDDDEYYD